jgi:hypothetical protein
VNHPIIRHELFSGSPRVNGTVIDMNYQWASTVVRTCGPDFFVKRCSHIPDIVLTVHSPAIRELIDNMKPQGAAHYCKHKLGRPNIPPHDRCDIISHHGRHSARRPREKESRLIPCYQDSPSVLKGSIKVGSYLTGNILPFLPEIVGQQTENPSQMKGFELKYLM